MSVLEKIAIGHRLKAMAGAILVHLRGNTEAQFTTIYQFGSWSMRGPHIPRSGPHATVETTVLVRKTLSNILDKYEIKSMLDAGCGDMTWMPLILAQHPGLEYTGADIVRDLVDTNKRRFPQSRFYWANLIEHVPERYDLIHCREALNHLKTSNVIRVLENFKQSDSRYLLLNNAPNADCNIDLIAQNGMYRAINWRLPPYRLEPIGEWPQDVSGRTYVLIPLNR